jgi:hypothetical protein
LEARHVAFPEEARHDVLPQDDVHRDQDRSQCLGGNPLEARHVAFPEACRCDRPSEAYQYQPQLLQPGGP